MMASSSDRDNEGRPARPTNDNPFIRFRQFADEQIGSLLQGIIGLPTAFTKNEGNHRWKDFDDELRRRDELQAKQRELKESEARRIQEETQGAATRSEGQKMGVGSGYTPNQETTGRDISLYSPVTKALFAHLLPSDVPKDWNQYHHPISVQDGYRVDFFPYKLRRGQNPSDHMEALQYMFYNELETSDLFRSDYSILPYLLFSPYSPIRLHLEELRPPKPNSPPRYLDQFPYHAAFADLIRTTQGTNEAKNLHSISRFGPFSSFSLLTHPNQSTAWISWIHELYGNNHLQQRETREIPRLTDLIPAGTFTTQKLPKKIDTASEDTQTELDMYNHFLQWASGPMVSALDAIDSVLQSDDSTVDKLLSALESQHAKQALEKLKSFDANSAASTEEFLQTLRGEIKRKQDERSNPTSPSKDLNGDEKGQIVSTSTTTSHITREDGTVETSVRVWKKYADGFEVVQTTNSVNGDRTGFQESSSKDETPLSPASEKSEGKKDEKKGWFWN